MNDMDILYHGCNVVNYVLDRCSAVRDDCAVSAVRKVVGRMAPGDRDAMMSYLTHVFLPTMLSTQWVWAEMELKHRYLVADALARYGGSDAYANLYYSGARLDAPEWTRDLSVGIAQWIMQSTGDGRWDVPWIPGMLQWACDVRARPIVSVMSRRQ